ncbi:MAG TPA: histidine kinase [Saprospiraceae bacterium]|nr:histidine kinase [Saprospiraceae bacterium]HMQ83610.1 histidine kinase [Saprospiraceae bacterium]
MDTLIQSRLFDNLYKVLNKRGVYHAFFWLFLLLVFIALEGTPNGFLFTLGNELIRLFFYSVIVYFNLLYLIPNYLTQNRFLTYCTLLVVACLVITPLEMMAFYFKFAHHPQAQANLLENRNWFFLLTFLVAGSSTIFKIVSDWVRHLRERQELQTQTMQSELRFLKSQINPHFLFNTLNNLYALTLKKSDQAPEIVIKLSEMMRYMLYECNEKQVLLSKEIDYIRNYLDLESLRQGKNVEISFEVEGRVGDQQIAPLMFIPFLENSFKHGLNNNLAAGFVRIRMTIADQTVQFYIENSKSNAPPKMDGRKSGGIGLVNIHRRLNLLYPGHYELHIEDSPNTYAVNLMIDLA